MKNRNGIKVRVVLAAITSAIAITAMILSPDGSQQKVGKSDGADFGIERAEAQQRAIKSSSKQ